MFGDPFENPKGYVKKTIGDVCDFQGGSQPPRKEFVFKPQEGYVRLIQIRDYKTDDYITYAPEKMCRRFCDADDIMIGRYGPPIFQILQGIEGAYNVALMKAIPHGINKEFMRAYLKRDELLHHLELFSTRTAGQSGIEMSELRGYPCLVPPEEEQLQYVEFVKQSDKSKFSCLKSQFIEMFGDPESVIDNAINTVADVADVQVGLVIKPTRFYSADGTGTPAFRSLNIGEMYIRDSEWIYFTDKGMVENQRTIAHTGDVLVVRSGYPGTSCVVTPEYDGRNVVDLIIAHPNVSKILPEFLCAFTNYPHGKIQIENSQRGVAQKHFNVSLYNKMKIVVPPMELQKQFVQLFHQSDKSK